jgi:hypothetical protein
MSQATPAVPYGVPPGPATNSLGNTAPGAKPCCTHNTTTLTKEDTRHLKIKLLMDPYLKKYINFVNLSDILTLLGIGMTDLPTLPKYCHLLGQLFLCWNSVLGKCFRGSRCKFSRGHAKRGDGAEAFANAVSASEKVSCIIPTFLPRRAPPATNARAGGGAAGS